MDPTFAWLISKLQTSHRRSIGYRHDPLANPFPRILIGDCERITPSFLLHNQITHIINCADDAACPEWARSILPYTCINAIDCEDVNLFETWYPAFKKAMDSYLRDPLCTNVYVHCRCGINRSVGLAGAYVCKTFGLPLEVSMGRIISQRPCSFTNPSFQRQIVEFVKKRY